MRINAGISISLNGTTKYKLTDHNRAEIDITNSLIEHSSRMANGKLKKYVISSKRVFSTSWQNLPSISAYTADQNYSSAWLEAFYNSNVFVPIYVTITKAGDANPTVGTAPSDSTYGGSFNNPNIEQVQCFITKFNIKIRKRTKIYDYVDMDIEFTEI